MIVKEHIVQDEQIAADHDKLHNLKHVPIDIEVLFASLRAHAKAALKAEIQADPESRGYAAKTPTQIADLVNREPSRVSMFWRGVAYAKNAVDEHDIREALS